MLTWVLVFLAGLYAGVGTCYACFLSTRFKDGELQSLFDGVYFFTIVIFFFPLWMAVAKKEDGGIFAD